MNKTGNEADKQVKAPEKIHGIKHFFAAASFSIGGLKRLVKETAFLHECIAWVAVLILLFVLGASLNDYLISFGLFMLLVCMEAVNTAIEVIVDQISPEWSVMARDAKDLGSLATLCIMLAYGAFLLSVIVRYFQGAL